MVCSGRNFYAVSELARHESRYLQRIITADKVFVLEIPV
jgi:hypothetical protein